MQRRNFIKATALLGTFAAAAASWDFNREYAKIGHSKARAKIVIIGGGAAGISMASRMSAALKYPDITLIDPSEKHFYQPGFTLIGSGVYQPDEVWHWQADCIPQNVKWQKDSVVAVDPCKNVVVTAHGEKLSYDFLVLTPGAVYDWNLIEGIDESTVGNGDANTIYTHAGAIKTWRSIQKFVKRGGRGIYTDTFTKHKCGGAPKKICLLTEHYARKNNARKNVTLDFFTASKQLYDVPFFTPRLFEIFGERNIDVNVNTRVAGVDTDAKKVYLKTFETEKIKESDGTEIEKISVKTRVENYDFLHFAPPMGAPKFAAECGLSATSGKRVAERWIDTDKSTLIHKKYPNIIAFGDASNLPTSKTSAAIRKQAPVAAANLLSLMGGNAPEKKYDGYAACPIVTDYGHVLLCEFDYRKKERISFPFNLLFDMSKEQRAAWLLKVYALKPMYFYAMLNGLA